MPPLPPFPPLPEANCGPNSFIPGQIPESSFHLPPVTVDTSVSVSLPSTPTPVGPKPSSSFPSPRASERNGTPSTDRDRSLSMTSTRSASEHDIREHLHQQHRGRKRGYLGGAPDARAVGLVFAVKEAMWEELTVLIAQRDEKLRKYGWETDDYCEILSRQKFEALMEQFESDIRVRISMWHSLVENGWEYPRREVVSKGELIEEIRLREEIIEARRKYTQDQDEDERPCRTIRLLLGVKES
ncbi:hypothetical protein A0H81_14228 [Grifola frondosa]|uniref:Uncharacterized protein n=1 Tax=Grifola frondosa TaxID=5627 RepID=A0A1C7LP80_GRIFR|nr:hypothetical protein A0H81_14228 [Grifola frondosa]